jgi:hypothetical protein
MKRIPPFKLIAEPLNDDASNLAPFKWAGGDVGKRHRLGGQSEHISESDYPSCRCGAKMSFYGQLDSINDEYDLADCGVISVFVCFDCYETKSVLWSA